MGKKGRIAEYRERLDQTLMCNDLMNKETLASLTKFCIHTTTRIMVKSDKEDIRVIYHEGPLGSPFHMLLAEGYIDAPIDICLCLAWESTIYQDWFPEIRIPTFKIHTAKFLQKIRIGEQIYLLRVKLSWPLTDREVILRYFEFEYFKDDLIIVVLNSVSDAENIISQANGYTHEQVVGAGQRVRVGLAGGFAFQKVTEDRSYFRVYFLSRILLARPDLIDLSYK